MKFEPLPSMSPSLARGLGARLYRTIEERTYSRTPRHLSQRISNIDARVCMGVPKKKRQKLAEELFGILKKVGYPIGAAYCDNGVFASYSLSPLLSKAGGIGISIFMAHFAQRIFDEWTIPNVYIKSTHLFERLILREDIRTMEDLPKLFRPIMEAVMVASNENNHDHILKGGYTGKVNIPTSNGGMVLGNMIKLEDGSSTLELTTYINAKQVANHNEGHTIHHTSEDFKAFNIFT